MTDSLLSTHGLQARYGDFQALFGIDFELAAGEVVALIGANGAGKSTLLRSLTGLLPVARPMVQLGGEAIGGLPAHEIVRRGLAMVPEGRRLFTGMSVEDNLRVAIDQARALALRAAADAWTLERLYALFPILRDKRRTPVESLSGGQQQMVAIGRALLLQPRVLLCDELSLGLAPKVVREIHAALPQITAAGTAIVLVEQDVGLAQHSSQRLYCMLEGRITLQGDSAAVTREAIAQAYFGGSHHAMA
ncbi:ABC transporter ATP-binding protein [Pseudacidovorax sp. RU35E]|uniref:ABC transporter ATP-binding protein n=1 Tax=Pseudacidovorax sp. RU35E TaxID=1907403 RepID=UPI0009548EF2|nr:ABC transporter ATP-binding protein [Pseudacidovorax sp. RU35E]SIR62933.1 amino acid/amide ABC transporter ATP-binding protein 2, HAAT family [Pseudacidovorax sp. RU35E]